MTVSEKLEGKVSSGGYLNAFRALTNEATVSTPMRLMSRLSQEDKSNYFKEMSELGLSQRSSNEKTNKIFVNFKDLNEAEEVLETLLDGFSYQFESQMETTKSYLLSFDSVAHAEEAIHILNASDDIFYSSMNYLYLSR